MKATKTIGASAAQTHFAVLLKFVAKGGEVIITRRGRPVAKLVPMEPPAANRNIVDRILAFRGRIKLVNGKTINDLADEGRHCLGVF